MINTKHHILNNFFTLFNIIYLQFRLFTDVLYLDMVLLLFSDLLKNEHIVKDCYTFLAVNPAPLGGVASDSYNLLINQLRV